MNIPTPPSQIITSRLWGIMGLFFVLFCVIIARLFYLQIYTASWFSYLGQKNFLRREKIKSQRGDILDRNGNLLATNRPTIELFWQGTGNRTLSGEQEQLIQALMQFAPASTLQDIPKIEHAGKKLLIHKDCDFTTISNLLERFPNHPNLSIETHFKRFYPYETLASHLVGYISSAQDESIGKMGLEKLFQQRLQGTPGEKLHIINSTGKRLEEHCIHHASAGKNIETTIDVSLQQIIERIFPAEHAGAFLVIQPQTGDILAMLSRPFFDPNMFISALTQSTWSAIQENNPFINRCFEACYPPASLFKLVTLAAALEEHIITPASTWHCIGHTEFCGRAYHCHNLYGHGTLAIQDALAQSCNIPFYDIGKKIKINTLAQYAHRFGLGEPTGIILPEKLGLVPTSQWKRHHKKEPWWPGETLSATIGQTYLSTTPAQALRMVSGIVEAKLVKFRIFQDEPEEIIPLDLKEEIRLFLVESLKQVITKGTGQKLKKFKDIELHGKTGTAQTSDLSKRDQGKLFLEHAWFVAHARYKNHPPIAFIIFVENVGSSSYAKHIAYNFLTEYCAYADQ